MITFETARLALQILIIGAFFRWFELYFGGRPGILGDLAEGLAVIY